MTPVVVVLGGWLVSAFVYRWLALRAVGALCTPAAAAPPPEPTPEPLRVVAIRPLHGTAPWLEPCLESLWNESAATNTPLVLGWKDDDDPAAFVVARVQARSPWPAELRVGMGPAGENPKIANMIQMTSGLHADVLLQSDADVRVGPGYVAAMTAPFANPLVGLATCPYRSMPGPSLASRLDALVTNTHFLPSACLAVQLEGLHFGLGATIAVRMSALVQAGGLDALLMTPADDYMLARNVEAAGAQLAWVPLVVEHEVADASWSRVLRRHLRWARVTRHVRLRGYCGQLLTHGSLPGLLLTIMMLRAHHPAGLLLPVLWWGSQAWALWQQREPLGLRARDLPLLPLADLMAFFVFLGGLVGSAQPS